MYLIHKSPARYRLDWTTVYLDMGVLKFARLDFYIKIKSHYYWPTVLSIPEHVRGYIRPLITKNLTFGVANKDAITRLDQVSKCNITIKFI